MFELLTRYYQVFMLQNIENNNSSSNLALRPSYDTSQSVLNIRCNVHLRPFRETQFFSKDHLTT